MDSDEEEFDNMFKETEKLLQNLHDDINNIKAITPNDYGISAGEESVIEECLNDTDGSLSSVNLDFFTDVPPKPIGGRRKKTMEKRKEERMGFRHVAAKATASDDEDDEEFMPSTSTKSDRTNTGSAEELIRPNFLQHWKEMKRISSETLNECLSEEKNLCSLQKLVRIAESGNERKSKPGELKMLKQRAIGYIVKMGGDKRLLRSKSVEELQRNYGEDKAESETLEQNSDMDFKVPPKFKKKIVSKVYRRKRILPPKSGTEEKSGKEFQNVDLANEEIDDVEPSTSKIVNVPKKRVRGVKRILSESDEDEEECIISDLNVAKKKVVRRKRRVSAKQEVAGNAHVYSFFSSMADLVSTLPYSRTLTAKAKVTKILEEMVEKVEWWKNSRSRLKPSMNHEMSDEMLQLIKLRLSKLPYVY